MDRTLPCLIVIGCAAGHRKLLPHIDVIYLSILSTSLSDSLSTTNVTASLLERHGVSIEPYQFATALQ